MKNRFITIFLVAMIVLSGCGTKNAPTKVQSEDTTNESSKESVKNKDSENETSEIKTDVEDILDCISSGNSKVNSGINAISYGTGTTYDEIYDEMCKGVELFEEAKTDYNAAIDLCEDASEYATLKKRLQKVIDSIPPKPTSATDKALDDFSPKYSEFITALANLETETEEFTKATGYIISHALK
ncbi:hypothetical protein [Butyrivibrio sp. XPD2002]|uniref:hypothetical protein n=1 Tax=Butyrivibrio sp. XPD2002 TaxID=1280665 RepID=UPI0004247F78|nr:hypothetical protein [Butyrivibrio sp. XPD2002]